MNTATVREVLAESSELIRFRFVKDRVWMSKGTIYRYWKAPIQEDLNAYMAFLRTYTSAKNLAASDTVVDPIIHRRNKRIGTYRQIEIGETYEDFDGKTELVVYQVLKEVTDGLHFEYASLRTRHTIEDTHVYMDWDTLIECPESTVGNIWRCRTTVDPETGEYQAELTRTKGVAWTKAYTDQTFAAAGGGVTVTLQGNQAAIPAPTANTRRNIYSHDWRENDQGLYDGRIRKKETAAKTFGPYIFLRTDDPVTSTYLYENQDAPVEVPSGFLGRSVFDRNPLDDTWSGNLNVREGTDTIDWVNERDYEFYFLSTRGEHIYVYVKYTSSAHASEDHLIIPLAQAATYTVVGSRDSHKTNIFNLGRNRFKAQRVQKLD